MEVSCMTYVLSFISDLQALPSWPKSCGIHVYLTRIWLIECRYSHVRVGIWKERDQYLNLVSSSSLFDRLCQTYEPWMRRSKDVQELGR